MPDATATVTRPKIELHIKVDEHDKATPVVPVAWSFSEELVDKLERNNYTNPHLVIVVGYQEVDTWDGETKVRRFHPTKVYAKSLNDKTPKVYVQFNRPGENLVMAFVVDIQTDSDKKRLSNWRHDVPSSSNFEARSKTGKFKIDLWNEYGTTSKRWNIASFTKSVTVDKDLFAKEPSKPAKALVRQFFRGREEDQCHFRKRFLISAFLATPWVQLWGLFARIATLLYALFMLSRNIRPRLLFALNPHDFAHSLGNSTWYYDKNGKRRSSLRWNTAPPTILIYLICAAIAIGVLLVPGLIITLIKHAVEIKGKTYTTAFTFGEVVVSSIVPDVIIFVVVFMIFLAFTKRGNRLVYRFFDWYAEKGSTKREGAEVVGDSRILELRKQAEATAAITSADQIADKTAMLVFKHVKSWVCKPFAQ